MTRENTVRRGDESAVAPAAARLAEALTTLRQTAGTPLGQFAALMDMSRVRLTMVEMGHTVPDTNTIDAYLRLPTLRPTERLRLRHLWDQAKREAERHKHAGATLDAAVFLIEREPRRRTPRARGEVKINEHDLSQDVHLKVSKPSWRVLVTKSQADPKLWPDPATITTVEEFTTALESIKSSTGLSYNTLADASKRASYPLARSTVHSLCTKKKLPSSPNAVACFIEICGGTSNDVQQWSSAWQRLAQQQVDDTVLAPDAGDDVVEDDAAEQGPDQVVEAVVELEAEPNPEPSRGKLGAQAVVTTRSGQDNVVSAWLLLVAAVVLFVAGILAGAAIF